MGNVVTMGKRNFKYVEVECLAQNTVMFDRKKQLENLIGKMDQSNHGIFKTDGSVRRFLLLFTKILFVVCLDNDIRKPCVEEEEE
jgi:hypothetical protein